MKTGNINYVCTDDCGVYNLDTKEITKIESPLMVDLLNVNKPWQTNKKKRTYRHSHNMTDRKTYKTEINLLFKKNSYYKAQKNKKFGGIINGKPWSENKRNKELSTKSSCKKLEERYLESEEDDSYYVLNEI